MRKIGKSCFISQVSNYFQQINGKPLDNLVHCGYLEYNRLSDDEKFTEIWLISQIDLLWCIYLFSSLICWRSGGYPHNKTRFKQSIFPPLSAMTCIGDTIKDTAYEHMD